MSEIERAQARLFASQESWRDRLSEPAPPTPGLSQEWANLLLRCAASLGISAAGLVGLLWFGHFLPVFLSQVIALHFVGRLGGWIVTIIGMAAGITLAALGYSDWWWTRVASFLIVMLVDASPKFPGLQPPALWPPDRRSVLPPGAARLIYRKRRRSFRLPADRLAGLREDLAG
jgi:hypothetical protein